MSKLRPGNPVDNSVDGFENTAPACPPKLICADAAEAINKIVMGKISFSFIIEFIGLIIGRKGKACAIILKD
jgi:hypothetical protein